MYAAMDLKNHITLRFYFMCKVLNCMRFSVLGHDTTASAIMWILYSLAKYPDMQQKVREDVEEVLHGRRQLEM